MLSSPLHEQPTPLVGRTDELQLVRERLTPNHVRLLTLTGPAGVGKTRVALEAGRQLASVYPDAVALVDLTHIREPDRLLPAIAQSLGIAEQNGHPSMERVEEFLRNRPFLLILDNFDRLPRAASQLSHLLARCAGIRMLVTSRAPLHLRWEQTLRIAPLAVPDLTVLASLVELATFPALALYVERVQAITPDFALTEDNARAVAELVVRLDGLPLAIELAAARSPVLSPHMLLERLQQHLSLLEWNAADLPERQHSLSTAIDWSYDLLTEDERFIFRQLGVFSGGFDLEAVEAVVGGTVDRALDVVATLGSLVDQSMIQVAEPGAEQIRYTMLESMRQYASDRLDELGELTSARTAHADYLLGLAERAEPRLQARDERASYLQLGRERENFEVALRWLLDTGTGYVGAPSAALRLVGALGYFWALHGNHADGRRWTTRVLNQVPGGDPIVRTKVLLSAGLLLMYGADFNASRAVLDEALALARQRHDDYDIALAFTRLGTCAFFVEDWSSSERFLEEALRYWKESADHFESGATLFYLGSMALIQRDCPRAVSLYGDSIAQFDAVGNERASGMTGLYLGIALMQLGGDLGRVTQLIRDGVSVSETHRDHWSLSLAVNAALLLVSAVAPPQVRAELLGAADSLRRQAGSDPGPWEHVMGHIAAHLGEQVEQERSGTAFRAGQKLPFDEVVTLTVATLADYSATLGPGEHVQGQRTQESPLSERELEVLELVAKGLSSKAIGKQLFIAVSTVNYHLTSIFNKLGVDTRAQAVAVAGQHGILPMRESDL